MMRTESVHRWSRRLSPFLVYGVLPLAVFVRGQNVDNDLWGHSRKVDELTRATTKANSGYVFGTTYTFVFDVGANNLVVTVNGTKEFDVSGTFSNGRFGCYDYSQADVTFAMSGYEEGSFSVKNALMFSCNS